MSTGAELEHAVMAAAKVYQAADRAELAKQHTPRLHGGMYAAKAPIDFKGWYRVGDRRDPLYVECKATSDGRVDFCIEGDGISETQLEAMRDAVLRDIRMLLVVDIVTESEVYVVDAREVVKFADAPWRKSLSLHWLRAFGEIARTDSTHLRRVWFLDTAPHAGRETAYLACVEEKRRAGKAVELFPAEQAPSKKLQQRFDDRPAPGTDEHKEYVRRLADEGLRRQMGSRPFSRARKKRWGAR